MDIKVGDIVTLKSSPHFSMTVEYIDDGKVFCVWFKEQEVKRDNFPVDTLELKAPQAKFSM